MASARATAKRWGRALGAIALLVPTGTLAQPPRCSLTVESLARGDAAYRARGERCEGVYVRQVAGSAELMLRGFHIAPPRYDLAADDVLTVTIAGLGEPPPGGTLLARSVRPRQYYQMDTHSVTDGEFRWRTDVLRHPDVRVAPADLATLFFVPVEDGPLRVWPVRVEGASAAGSPDAVRPYLILESEVELTRIVLTVRPAGGGEAIERRTLPRRSYPPDYPIRVTFDVPSAGEYAVTLTSISREGASGQLDLIVVVPAEALTGR